MQKKYFFQQYILLFASYKSCLISRMVLFISQTDICFKVTMRHKKDDLAHHLRLIIKLACCYNNELTRAYSCIISYQSLLKISVCLLLAMSSTMKVADLHYKYEVQCTHAALLLLLYKTRVDKGGLIVLAVTFKHSFKFI